MIEPSLRPHVSAYSQELNLQQVILGFYALLKDFPDVRVDLTYL